jgi:hypothetical protein
MNIRFAAALLMLLLTMPVIAMAQGAVRTPVVEVGADVSGAAQGDGPWTSLGGRLRLNFDRRTAVEGIFSPERGPDDYWQADYVTVQVRRSLHTWDGGVLFGALGATVGHHTFREVPAPGREPLYTFTSRSLGPSFSFGTEVEVAPYLAFRAETQYVLSDDSMLRFSGGVSVPIGGRYPGRDNTESKASLARTPLAQVRSGQHAWITVADGREYAGEVVSRGPDAVTLRHRRGATSIATADIVRIDAPDRLLNGIMIGMGAGGAAGGVLGGILGDFVCESSNGCVTVGALLVGGMGAGMGSLIGAMVDGIRDNRRPVYDRSATPRAQVTLAPVLSRDKRGVAAIIRW